MTQIIRRISNSSAGRALVLILATCALVALFALTRHGAEGSGSPYADPFWDNTSTVSACSACGGCGCPSAPTSSPEGVDVRSGELFVDHAILTFPGRVSSLNLSVRWRSMIDGVTQMGAGAIGSWETTAEKVILDENDPDGDGGHEVRIRHSSGEINVFGWDAVSYSPETCLVTDTLTTDTNGDYLLTSKTGETILFDSNGMPNEFGDRNGNIIDFDYDSNLQLTDITDTRGKSFTITSNTDGYITEIEDPAGREWTFTYDANNNLKTIKTPTTADQTSGITTTWHYDGSDRLTSIVDGRGNTVYEYAYDGSTKKISTVTIDGDDVDYSYSSGLTTRTDGEGNVHRYHFTGSLVDKTDMLVGGTAKYVTEYRYTGDQLDTIVYPRDNRVDFTWDSENNLTERRQKTTDTSTNGSSDIVESWTYNSGNYMTGYTDKNGNAWTYTVDSSGNRTGVTHPTVTNPASQSASTTTTFNSYGQITKFTDEEGTETTYTYFSSGPNEDLLEKTTVDPTGLAITTIYGYDSALNVTTVTDPLSNVTTRTFDNLRRVTETQAPAPLNYKVKFSYDGNSNLTKREVENIDKDGTRSTSHPWITTSYTYTDRDQLATQVEDIDSTTTRTTSHTYDANGNRTQTTLPEGNKIAWTYNERDLVATHVRGYGATEASTRTNAYDDNGNLTTVTDGRNNDTTYTYDLFDRRTKVTDELNHYTKYTLDDAGNVTKIQRYDSSNTELQRSTRYFDERGRHWKTSDLRKQPGTTYSDAVTTMTRLKTGQVSKITDALSNDTLFDYDAAGRRIEVEDAMGNVVTSTLDKNGNVTATSIEEIDGASSVTHEYSATYDELGRKTSVTEKDRLVGTNSLTTDLYYDSRGNRTFLVNAEGNPTRWTFDGLGRMTKRERAISTGTTIDDFTAAQVTEWGFDKNSRLDSHKDDGGNNTTWAYDALNRKTTMTYPNLKTVSWVYDKEDNVTQITDAAGNVIADTFDALGRNTARTVTRATGFVGTTSETRTFDALGRMLTNNDNDYKLTFEHAVLGMRSLLYSEKQEYATGTAHAKTVKNIYDALGRKTTEEYPSGLDLTYTYNDIGALSTISDGTNTIASYTYIGMREKKATFENDTTQENSYSGFRNEVSSIHHKDSVGNTLVRMDYGYNDVHDRTYERFGASGSSGDAFVYDNIRRLEKAYMGSTTPDSPVGNAYDDLIEFDMDDDGNRNTKDVTPYGGSASSTSYTTNNLNQYTAVGGTTYLYDDNGNLTDDGNQEYVYDYRNQLVEVRDNVGLLIASYKYDAAGRRVEKTVDSVVERHILSGVEVIEACNGQTTWKQRFVYGQGIDKVVMLEQADVLDFDGDSNTTELTRNFYHRNALGSVMYISEEDETEAAEYRYTPYGEWTITRGGVTQGSDPLGQDVGYTGRWFDEESGLWQYRARYYSHEDGRFLGRDPLGHDAGVTLYLYADANPVQFRDPFGTTSESYDRIRRLDVAYGVNWERQRSYVVNFGVFDWKPRVEVLSCWGKPARDKCRGQCGPVRMEVGPEIISSTSRCKSHGKRAKGKAAEAEKRLEQSALSSAQSKGKKKCQALGDGCECQIEVKSKICTCQDSRNDEYGGWTLTIKCTVYFKNRKCARK